MAKMIHTMVRVLDEARSLDFYRRAFGFEIVQRADFDSFTLIYIGNGETPFELELTVNKGRTEPYSLGEGYGHIAVSVDDIEAEHARFTAEGLNPRQARGDDPRGQAVRPLLLRHRSRRLQDRGAGARRAVPLMMLAERECGHG